MTKPFHAGRAAEAGVIAADLVGLGWTATDKILEAPRGFFRAAGGGYDAEAIAGKLGKPWVFTSPGISIKPQPSHQRLHGGEGRCRHQSQHAQRPYPSASAERVAGQVQHGILHGDPALG